MPKPVLETAQHSMAALLSANMSTTEYFEIDSDVAGARYGVWVNVPWNYAQEAERRYPAIFMPDGNLMAPALIPYSGGLQQPPLQPFVQVCVGYCGADVDEWLLKTRNRDLVPQNEPPSPAHLAAIEAGIAAGGEAAEMNKKFRDAMINGGRADLFLGFLTEELFPLVVERWRIDTSCCGLFGHSYGGLFAAWAAMQRPAAFPRIGAASPGITTENSKVFELLTREVASGADHSGRHLHLSIGEAEITSQTGYQMLGAAFAKLTFDLGQRPLKGLQVTNRIIAGEDHMTSLPGKWFSFVRDCYSAS